MPLLKLLEPMTLNYTIIHGLKKIKVIHMKLIFWFQMAIKLFQLKLNHLILIIINQLLNFQRNILHVFQEESYFLSMIYPMMVC